MIVGIRALIQGVILFLAGRQTEANDPERSLKMTIGAGAAIVGLFFLVLLVNVAVVLILLIPGGVVRAASGALGVVCKERLNYKNLENIYRVILFAFLSCVPSWSCWSNVGLFLAIDNCCVDGYKH